MHASPKSLFVEPAQPASRRRICSDAVTQLLVETPERFMSTHNTCLCLCFVRTSRNDGVGCSSSLAMEEASPRFASSHVIFLCVLIGRLRKVEKIETIFALRCRILSTQNPANSQLEKNPVSHPAHHARFAPPPLEACSAPKKVVACARPSKAQTQMDVPGTILDPNAVKAAANTRNTLQELHKKRFFLAMLSLVLPFVLS